MKRSVRDRKLSPEEAEKYARLRALIELDKPEIAGRAKTYRAVTHSAEQVKQRRRPESNRG